jgi:hypothetical protein
MTQTREIDMPPMADGPGNAELVKRLVAHEASWANHPGNHRAHEWWTAWEAERTAIIGDCLAAGWLVADDSDNGRIVYRQAATALSRQQVSEEVDTKAARELAAAMDLCCSEKPPVVIRAQADTIDALRKESDARQGTADDLYAQLMDLRAQLATVTSERERAERDTVRMMAAILRSTTGRIELTHADIADVPPTAEVRRTESLETGSIVFTYFGGEQP